MRSICACNSSVFARTNLRVCWQRHVRAGGGGDNSTHLLFVRPVAREPVRVVSKHGSIARHHTRDEPLGQIAAHPRLVHVSQGTYCKSKNTALRSHRRWKKKSKNANARTFRSHFNLSLMDCARTYGPRGSEIGPRTADTPHMTRGRARACGAVWEGEEAPHCPRASRTPARP